MYVLYRLNCNGHERHYVDVIALEAICGDHTERLRDVLSNRERRPHSLSRVPVTKTNL